MLVQYCSFQPERAANHAQRSEPVQFASSSRWSSPSSASTSASSSSRSWNAASRTTTPPASRAVATTARTVAVNLAFGTRGLESSQVSLSFAIGPLLAGEHSACIVAHIGREQQQACVAVCEERNILRLHRWPRFVEHHRCGRRNSHGSRAHASHKVCQRRDAWRRILMCEGSGSSTKE